MYTHRALSLAWGAASLFVKSCAAHLSGQVLNGRGIAPIEGTKILFTPPTPIPTVRGTHSAGNVAEQPTLSPGNAHAVVDGNLQTEWIGGHMVGFELHWAFPVTIHRVVVWDRKQSSTDNNQINKLKLSFSDGSSTGSIDMVSEGPRCADITFPSKTITTLQVIPVDASGSNGFREIEVWATSGPQYSNNTCVNKKTVSFI